MSKGLDALVNLMARVSCGEDNIAKAKYDYDIIENELKRTSDYDFLGEHYRECLKENEKLNKALEIIKELFDIKVFETDEKYFITFMSTNRVIRYHCTEEIKNKEKYDLLKEVLL